MIQKYRKLQLAALIILGLSGVSFGQTVKYWTQFETTGTSAPGGDEGPYDGTNNAPLPGPRLNFIDNGGLTLQPTGTRIDGTQPNSYDYALSQFSYKTGSNNYMRYHGHTPPITVTAGKWYLIEVWVSDNSTAADFNVSSINAAPTAWDDFDTHGSRIKHLRTTQIEPDFYTKWEVMWYCETTETRYFAVHEDFYLTGNNKSECFIDDFKITEWDCAITTYGPGGGPTDNYDIDPTATPSAVDFCDLSGYEMLWYESIRKDMGVRGEVVLEGDATDVWMDAAIADCWTIADGAGGHYVVAYEIPPTTDAVYLTIENWRTDDGFTVGSNTFNIYITDATCSSPTGLYCNESLSSLNLTLAAGDVTNGAYIYLTDATVTQTYGWEDGNIVPWFDEGDLFDICVSTVAGYCDSPLQTISVCETAGDAIAVYAPDDGGGNVTCDELDGVGGSPDGIGADYTNDGGTTDIQVNNALSSYPIVTADNFTCTTTDITLTNAGPDWTDLDGALDVSTHTAYPLPENSSPIEIEYALNDFGRKTLTADSAYCDFLFMQTNQVAPGAILGSNFICPDTFLFSSSDAGTPGYNYEWFVENPTDGSSEIFTDTASSTRIRFENTGTDTILFVVKLLITSECCGPLDTVYFNSNVFPRPSAPTPVTPDSTCVGGFDTLSVSPNYTSSGYSYNWYGPDNNTLLYPATDPKYKSISGNLYVDSTLYGSHYYKVEAVDYNGCVSATKDSVEHVGVYYLPVVDTIFPCNASCNPICVQNPIVGATYRWYSDIGLGAADLEQEGVSSCYSICVDTLTLTGKVWVTVEDAAKGCNETSPGEQGDAIVTGSYTTLHFYDFTGDNDWFNGRNWSDRAPAALLGDGTDTAYCIPSCGINAFVRSDCEISFGSTGEYAYCNNITLVGSADLSFTDAFASLYICGNATFAGDIIMEDGSSNGQGKVAFVGTSGPQRFINTKATNKFFVMEINNTSAAEPWVYFFAPAHQNMIIRDDGQLRLISGILTPDASTYSHASLTNNDLKVVVENDESNSVIFQSTASYVNGTLDRYMKDGSDYEFPVGNEDSYQLFELQNVSGMTASGMNDLNVRFDLANADLGRAVEDTAGLGAIGLNLQFILDNGVADGLDNGIWTAEPDAGAADYDVVLHGRNYAKVDTIWLTAVKRDAVFNGYPTLSPATPGLWGIETSTDLSTISGIAGTLAVAGRAGYSGFSQFAIAVAPTIPLPLDMVYFNAHAKNEMVYLDWETVNEVRNDHFMVQRSKDTKDWEDVEKVAGSGTKATNTTYEYVDADPYSGVSYYRLMVYSKTGEAFPTRSVKVNFDKDFDYSLYPNPASNMIELRIAANKVGNAKIYVHNSLGALVDERPATFKEGNNTIKFDLNKYSRGVYHMKISTSETTEDMTFVVE